MVRSPYLDLLTPFLGRRGIGSLAFDRDWRRKVGVKKYDGALLLFDEPGLFREARRAGIRPRVGPFSKLRSLFFLNLGVRRDDPAPSGTRPKYNLELAQVFATRLGATAIPPPALELPVAENHRARAVEVIQGLGLGLGPFVVVHPGMGGSALNLSPENYALIISIVEKTVGPVLISVGPAGRDAELARALTARLPKSRILSGLGLGVLAEVFRRARLVIAPSTGPLHLAHYVGAATVGLYPPVKSQHPRDGRRGAERDGARYFHPRLCVPRHTLSRCALPRVFLPGADGMGRFDFARG